MVAIVGYYFLNSNAINIWVCMAKPCVTLKAKPNQDELITAAGLPQLSRSDKLINYCFIFYFLKGERKLYKG